MHNGVVVFDVPQCLIITRQKIGTQFIQSYFEEELRAPLLEHEHPITKTFTIQKTESQYKINEVEPDKYPWGYKLESYEESLNRFLNEDNFDKDTIVLIRDPRKRFISALNQDFVKFFLEPNNSRVLEILGNVHLDENDRKWWIENKMEWIEFINDRDNVIQISEELKPIIEKLVKVILQGYINGNYPINSNHNSPYHQTLQSILINPKNESKVKVFDIDEVHLNDVFVQYKNKELLQKTNKSHDQIIPIIKKLVYENPILKSKLEEGQIKEIEAYNFIKEKFV